VTEERNNPDVTDDDQARRGTPSRGTGDIPATTGDPSTRDPGNRDDTRPRSLGGMEAARRAVNDVLELTGRQPEHVVSVAKQDDSWHIGLEVVELQRIPESADVLAVYEVTLDAHGELVTCRRGRRYLRGGTEESR
jgi:Gas vesicle synthesis protein GvpO